MDRRKTAITSSFLGLVRRGSCPVCGAPIAVNLGFTTLMLCPNCGDYLEVVEKQLRQMDPTLINPTPSFAAPTPWPDMCSPTFPTISFHQWDDLITEATDWVLTKKEGLRVIDAKWPAGCCVCGEQPTREETTGQKFTFTPPGLVRVRSKEATIIAKGIPHCAEHEHGAVFERAMFSTPQQQTVVGLFFRSYAYQIQFRNLNPWKWEAPSVKSAAAAIPVAPEKRSSLAGQAGSGSPQREASALLDEAWRLLQASQIEQGRALLLDLCSRDRSNFTAQALAAFELHRPPAQERKRNELLDALERLDPEYKQGVFRNLIAAFSALQFTVDGYRMGFEMFGAQEPSDRHEAALFLLARVLLSDCLVQITFGEVGHNIAVMAQPASQGGARFVLRDPRALETFHRGIENPTPTIVAYEVLFGRQLSSVERVNLISTLAFDCRIGCGLLHRDRGEQRQAHGAFREALPMAVGFGIPAIQILLNEGY